ncbi:hypothetical protein D9M70_389340 [compost metagenome]
MRPGAAWEGPAADPGAVVLGHGRRRRAAVGARQRRRAGPRTLLRPCAAAGAGQPGRGGHRRPGLVRRHPARGAHPAARAAGTPALPAGLVAHRGRLAELAPLFRDQRPGWRTRGRPAGLRRGPCAGLPPAARRLDRRRARGSCRRAGRSRRLLPPPARRARPARRRAAAAAAAAAPVARGRENPRQRRTAAAGLAGRRHHRLRLHGRDRRRAARRGRRSRADRAVGHDQRRCAPVRRARARGPSPGAAAAPRHRMRGRDRPPARLRAAGARHARPRAGGTAACADRTDGGRAGLPQLLRRAAVGARRRGRACR